MNIFPTVKLMFSVTGYIYTAVTMPKTRTDSVCRITPSGRLPSQTFRLGAAKKNSVAEQFAKENNFKVENN